MEEDKRNIFCTKLAHSLTASVKLASVQYPKDYFTNSMQVEILEKYFELCYT